MRSAPPGIKQSIDLPVTADMDIEEKLCVEALIPIVGGALRSTIDAHEKDYGGSIPRNFISSATKRVTCQVVAALRRNKFFLELAKGIL